MNDELNTEGYRRAMVDIVNKYMDIIPLEVDSCDKFCERINLRIGDNFKEQYINADRNSQRVVRAVYAIPYGEILAREFNGEWVQSSNCLYDWRISMHIHGYIRVTIHPFQKMHEFLLGLPENNLMGPAIEIKALLNNDFLKGALPIYSDSRN